MISCIYTVSVNEHTEDFPHKLSLIDYESATELHKTSNNTLNNCYLIISYCCCAPQSKGIQDIEYLLSNFSVHDYLTITYPFCAPQVK